MSENNTNETPAPLVMGTYGQISAISERFLTIDTHKQRVQDYPNCGIVVSQEYFNTMRDHVTLVDRNGFKIYVAGQGSSSGGGCLRIVTRYVIKSCLPGESAWSGLQYLMKIFRPEHTRDVNTTLGQLYLSYHSQYHIYTNRNGYPPSEYVLMVETEFTSLQLRTLENRRCVYNKRTDLVISFVQDPETASEHPYSEVFKTNSPLVMTYMADDRLDRGMASLIEIVDSDQKYGYRYMWMAGQVVCIRPIVDRGREDGVYFKYHANAMHDKDTKPQVRKCTLEQMGKEFGLYPTQEEAITGGNPELISKTNKAAQDKELEELKAVYAREGIQHKREREEAEEKARIEKLEHENKVRALEIEHSKRITDIKEENERRALERRDFYEQRGAMRKDTYEDRSFDRKDKVDTAVYTREMLRVGFVIIAAVIGWVAKSKLSSG